MSVCKLEINYKKLFESILIHINIKRTKINNQNVYKYIDTKYNLYV